MDARTYGTPRLTDLGSMHEMTQAAVGGSTTGLMAPDVGIEPVDELTSTIEQQVPQLPKLDAPKLPPLGRPF
jgi:hypothetical protein